MPDWTAILQALGAIVQAGAAVVIVRLTTRVAKANDQLARATDAYAKSAKDQVDELVQARLATIQPYLHLVSAGTTGTPDPYLIGLGVEAELANLGSGPSLDAVARLWHERLQFIPATPPQTVAAGAGCKLSFEVRATTAAPGGQALMQDVRLIVEYRDLAGRWWVTTTPGTVGQVREPNGTYRETEVLFRVQEETVARLAQPTLTGTVLAEDRDVNIWAIG